MLKRVQDFALPEKSYATPNVIEWETTQHWLRARKDTCTDAFKCKG